MAITVSQLGSTQNETSQSSVSISGLITAAQGDWLLVFVGCDNAGTGGAASLSGVSDSAGNTWEEQFVLNRDPGAANVGCTLGTYSCKVTSDLSSGSITVSFNPNTTAKCVQVYRLVPQAGYEIKWYGMGTGDTGSSTSMSADVSPSLPSGYVIFGATCLEYGLLGSNSAGDSDTTNGSWSTRFLSETGSESNAGILLQSQYKITTGTGAQTYNTTAWYFAVDFCINYTVFYESALNFPSLVIKPRHLTHLLVR